MPRMGASPFVSINLFVTVLNSDSFELSSVIPYGFPAGVGFQEGGKTDPGNTFIAHCKYT